MVGLAIQPIGPERSFAIYVFARSLAQPAGPRCPIELDRWQVRTGPPPLGSRAGTDFSAAACHDAAVTAAATRQRLVITHDKMCQSEDERDGSLLQTQFLEGRTRRGLTGGN